MKLVYTFLALIALTALSVEARRIDPQTAAAVAASFLQAKGITIDAQPQFAAKGIDGTTATAPYYVFAGTDGKGFVIVSGDDRTESVLGSSTTGTFNVDRMQENLRAWLAGYAEQINALDSLGIPKWPLQKPSPPTPFAPHRTDGEGEMELIGQYALRRPLPRLQRAEMLSGLRSRRYSALLQPARTTDCPPNDEGTLYPPRESGGNTLTYSLCKRIFS